jgi:hypothetical protein
MIPLASKMRFQFSDDLSGFDNTVSFKMKRTLADSLVKYGLMTGDERDVFLAIESSDVIGGSHYSEDAGYLYHKEDGLNSGNLLTSIVGNLINTARTVSVMAYTFNLSLEDLWLKLDSEWSYFIWGDDTVIFSDREIDRNVWQDNNEQLGWKSTALPGVVFLMKFYDLEQGSWFPLASRFGMQTIFREHPPRNQAVELLGLAARSEGLDRHPCGSEAWDIVTQDSDLMTDYPEARNRSDLLHLLNEPYILGQIAEGEDDPFAIERIFQTDLINLEELRMALGRPLQDSYADLTEMFSDVDLGAYPIGSELVSVTELRLQIDKLLPTKKQEERT